MNWPPVECIWADGSQNLHGSPQVGLRSKAPTRDHADSPQKLKPYVTLCTNFNVLLYKNPEFNTAEAGLTMLTAR